MKKAAAAWLIGVSWAAGAISAPPSPLDLFVADKEFCAYMASLPEQDDEKFLARYEAAMREAVAFIRHENARMTNTQAIFEVKARCDAALNGLIHYK